jgi:hypothetical protein
LQILDQISERRGDVLPYGPIGIEDAPSSARDSLRPRLSRPSRARPSAVSHSRRLVALPPTRSCSTSAAPPLRTGSSAVRQEIERRDSQ